jgi:hypothetical protein
MPLTGAKVPLTALAAFVAVFLILCAFLAQGPDGDVQFIREVPVQISRSTLNETLNSLPLWKKWFFTMSGVERVDRQGHPLPPREQVLAPGAIVAFHVDPKKGKSRRFELLTEITEFVPGQSVTIRVLEDSHGKLTHLFDRIEWRIQVLEPDATHPLRVAGTETAHTAHWRARLFSKISGRTLLNQLFYPDLITLSRPQATEVPEM